jgi:spore germination cell wall hydrolase CwlJ-like protein
MSDTDILARTKFGEARGEGLEGMEAVACVIINRVKAKKWFTGYELINGVKVPNVAQTCLKKAQFSCWNKNDANYPLLKKITAESPIFRICLKVAERALNGQLTDFTNGALYYHTKAIKPKWAVGKSPCYEVKNHLFYNDI